MHMSNVSMACDARHLLGRGTRLGNRYRMDHRLMARTAGLFGDLPVSLCYLNGFVKAAESEIVGMPKAVPRLCRVFPDHVGRRVTVVAGGDGLVARLLPAVVLVVHYVAVGTRSRVVAKIGSSLPVPKCKQTNPDRQPKSNAHNDQPEQVEAH
jgi:hypothetical protein